MDSDPQGVLYALLAVVAVLYVIRWRSDPLKAIPTVGGPAAPILSYVGAWHYLRDGKELLAQGYAKYHNSVFRIAALDRWYIVVSGPKLIDELRKRSDDELSFHEAVEQSLQIKHTVGKGAHEDPYHIEIIRDRLMRTLPLVLPHVIDELSIAVPDYIATSGDEWVVVNATTTMQKIVARASNRVFVGLPLCRNEEFLELAIAFTMDVIRDKAMLYLLPDFIKAIVAPFASIAVRNSKRAAPFLKPLLHERRAMIQEHGDDWDGKPNDMLQWILEASMARRNVEEDVTEKILLINFAAIHTSTTTIVNALYDLAARPEYIQPLREEVQSRVAAEGWTKTAMGQMWKVDSFLKESTRWNGIATTSMDRKVMKDITLSDGTFIPKGSTVTAASNATHFDESVYTDAAAFDPFRFARMREAAGEGTKHQFVNTSVQYMSFGHGKHACPGRFFAANELKAMLAYIVMHYDLKLPGDGSRPENIYVAAAVVANPKGELMFRKRQSTA